MTDLDDELAGLGEALAADISGWASLASLASDDGAATAVPGAVTATLAERLARPAGAPGDPRRWLAGQLARWLQRRHQFFEWDARAAGEVEAVAGRWLAGICAGDPVAARREARAGLAAFVRARLGERPRDVVCSEYSPALQLAVLGLADGELPEPILDVGCGPGAGLVRALISRGHDARGLDRDAPGDVATAGDWLRFDYGVDRWGAVLSHHGFSLHFLHHHLRPDGAAHAYATVYMQILRSLRPGGLFAYVPALPFLEAMLPRARWRCTAVPLPPGLHTPAMAALQAETGLALDHATQVLRVG